MVIATHASGILPYSLFYIRPAHIMSRYYVCTYMCLYVCIFVCMQPFTVDADNYNAENMAPWKRVIGIGSLLTFTRAKGKGPSVHTPVLFDWTRTDGQTRPPQP